MNLAWKNLRMRQALVVLSWMLATSCGAASVCTAATLIERNAAARLGMARAWYAQVGSQRSTGSISHVSYGRGMLLVQSTRGMLTALDAETGRAVWSTQVGPSDHLSTQPDANEEFVVVVSGSVLYVLDRAAGHILWQKQLGGAPGAGPGVTATHAFVPMVSGLVEGYDLKKGAKQTPWIYKSAGRVLIPPMGTPQSVSWTTEKGYFYVADPSAGGVRYRLETRDAIQSRPAYWTPMLYACSTDGYVYALNETSGHIQWKFPVGDAIYNSPVAIDGLLYVVSQLSGMNCLDGASGKPLWFAPKITQFVSRSPSRVYACDQLGRLIALDGKTGARLGALPLDGVSVKLINHQSDRVFLANDACVVQCLREVGLRSPKMHVPPEAEKPAPGAKSTEPKDESTEESAPAPKDEPAAIEETDEAEKPAMSDDKPAEPAEDDADNPFK